MVSTLTCNKLHGLVSGALLYTAVRLGVAARSPRVQPSGEVVDSSFGLLDAGVYPVGLRLIALWPDAEK